jgi:L-amino acid N-acyltransferase YncA
MIVRPALLDDAVEIAYIYNHYIATSHATFEVEPIDGDEMLRKMEDGWDSGYPFLVADDNGTIVGYAYGQRFRPRVAYSHSVEVSVYIRPGGDDRGIGSLLYEGLFSVIKAGNYHAVIAGISLPNNASIALHEKFGLTKAAHFREVGRKFDQWIDVAYYQMLIAK